jgi:hypothetical protein
MQTFDLAIERRRAGQRGSALLIVFVFAAFVAIMLYKEMPVTLFEAKRQKEQLLIDRGNEYKRGIKLFVIRNRTFPTSLDQLEKFNNVRYIRHRFKDPMTGGDEWRLIHVTGPGFVLTDSKVNPLKKVDDKTGLGTSAASAGAAADPNQPGGGASASEQAPQQQNTQPTVDSVAYVTPGQPVVYHLYPNQATAQNQAAGQNQIPGQPSAQNPAAPRSRPAVPAGNFAAQQQVASQIAAEENNEKPPGAMPEMFTADGSSEPIEQDSAEQVEDAVPDQAGEQPLMTPGARPPGGALPEQAAPMQNPAMPNPGMPNPAMQQNGSSQSNPVTPRIAAALGNGAQQASDPAAVSPEGMAAVQNMLRRGGTVPAGSATASNRTTISSGAIAGVASKATGKSIKQIDKQTDYSKWEFVYDPQKEPKVVAGSIGSGMAGGVANGAGTSLGGSQNGLGNSSSGFGNSNSGFGNSSSGFGNSNSGSGNSRGGFGGSSSGFGSSPASAPAGGEPAANDTN